MWRAARVAAVSSKSISFSFSEAIIKNWEL